MPFVGVVVVAVSIASTPRALTSVQQDSSSAEPMPFPAPFAWWHLDSGFFLVIYLAVHVWRRRTRLRRSTIR